MCYAFNSIEVSTQETEFVLAIATNKYNIFNEIKCLVASKVKFTFLVASKVKSIFWVARKKKWLPVW